MNKQKALNYLNKNKLVNLNMIYVINHHADIELHMNDNYEGVAIKRGHIIYLHSTSYEFISSYLDSLTDSYIMFSAVADECMSYIVNYFYNHQLSFEWQNICYLYCYLKPSIDTSVLKYKPESLTLDDSIVVDEYYTYRHEGSLKIIQTEISSGVNSCIRVNDELASWSLTHLDGSMGVMYTKEKFRKHGLAVDVTIDFVDKLIKQGSIPFSHIVVENIPSINLAHKLGFERIATVHWGGVELKKENKTENK